MVVQLLASLVLFSGPQPEPAGWSERGVFAGPWITVDFWLQQERMGPFHGKVRDCSTPDLYCADGAFTSVVAPRRCGDMEAGLWSVGGVTTRSVGTFRAAASSGDTHRVGHLLASEATPFVIYVWDGDLNRRFVDVTRRLNLIEAAERDGLAGLKELVNTRAIVVNTTLTFDRFGWCTGDRPVLPGEPEVLP